MGCVCVCVCVCVSVCLSLSLSLSLSLLFFINTCFVFSLFSFAVFFLFPRQMEMSIFRVCKFSLEVSFIRSQTFSSISFSLKTICFEHVRRINGMNEFRVQTIYFH